MIQFKHRKYLYTQSYLSQSFSEKIILIWYLNVFESLNLRLKFFLNIYFNNIKLFVFIPKTLNITLIFINITALRHSIHDKLCFGRKGRQHKVRKIFGVWVNAGCNWRSFWTHDSTLQGWMATQSWFKDWQLTKYTLENWNKQI